MSTETHEKIREIKKSLRLSMNGIVSAHQRRQGLNYKINFGVEIPRIKEIAAEHTKEKEVAQSLWQENIRECKLLAIFLYPTEEFDQGPAEKWIGECGFTEIADHLSRTLLATLPEATTKSLEWSADENDMFSYCGFSTLSNLFTKGTTLNDDEEKRYFEALKSALHTPGTASKPTQNAATISLIKFADGSDEQRARVCAEIKSWGIEKDSALENLVKNMLE